MKFSEKYIDPKEYEQFDFEGDTIVHSFKVPSNCCVCGEMTNFHSLSFLDYFCSEECNRKMWIEYFKALKQ